MHYRLILTLLFLAGTALAVWAEPVPPQGPLDPAAQKLIQLVQGGVDEPTLLAFIKNNTDSYHLTVEGILALKKAGVPGSVISAALDKEVVPQRVSNPEPVEERDLFRTFWGRIYYGNRVYFLGSDLDPGLEKVLLSDPTTGDDLKGYHDLRNTSGNLIWGGLGLVVGGGIFAAVAGGSDSAQAGWTRGTALGAMGLGFLATVVGNFMSQSSYQNLFNAMTRYNQDLIAGQVGR